AGGSAGRRGNYALRTVPLFAAGCPDASPAASRNDECPTNAPPMTKGKTGKRYPSSPSSLVGHWWGIRQLPRSGRRAQLGRRRDLQRVFLDPPAGVRCPAPLLELDGGDVFLLLVVEQFEERLGVLVADVRRGAAHEDQRVGSVVEDCDRTPALGLGFGL